MWWHQNVDLNGKGKRKVKTNISLFATLTTASLLSSTLVFSSDVKAQFDNGFADLDILTFSGDAITLRSSINGLIIEESTSPFIPTVEFPDINNRGVDLGIRDTSIFLVGTQNTSFSFGSKSVIEIDNLEIVKESGELANAFIADITLDSNQSFEQLSSAPGIERFEFTNRGYELTVEYGNPNSVIVTFDVTAPESFIDVGEFVEIFADFKTVKVPEYSGFWGLLVVGASIVGAKRIR